jgi:hypothetical protein
LGEPEPLNEAEADPEESAADNVDDVPEESEA